MEEHLVAELALHVAHRAAHVGLVEVQSGRVVTGQERGLTIVAGDTRGELMDAAPEQELAHAGDGEHARVAGVEDAARREIELGGIELDAFGHGGHAN